MWGAAATALLGATLAEWQKKKEEDAALLAQYTARSSDGGGDEEEEASDVVARKRAKVMAKNQAKRAQESRWEAARVKQQAKVANKLAKIDTDEERLEAYKETASYQARQESYAVYYAQKEKEKQAEANRHALITKNEATSPVDMANVNVLASVAQVKQEEEKEKSSQYWKVFEILKVEYAYD